MNPSTRQHPLPGSPSSAREESAVLDWAGDRSRHLGMLQGANPAGDTLREKRQRGGHVTEVFGQPHRAERGWAPSQCVWRQEGGRPLPGLSLSTPLFQVRE